MGKMMTAVAASALSVMILMATSVASADTVLPPLELRLNGTAVYDPVANLTWLADANYAQTSGYDDDGLMNWHDAMTWAASLNLYGVTGWRLPEGAMAFGYNQTASEMGNLYYNVLGGTAYIASIHMHHNANYDLFKNIGWGYWSGVQAGWGTSWEFYFFNGEQVVSGDQRYPFFAWAVHDGDVGASPVPLPATLFLLAPGLAGLGFLRRRAT